MDNLKLTYRIPLFIGFLFVWELIFWIGLWWLLSLLGVFSSADNESFVFIYPHYAWFFVVIAIIIGIFWFQLYRHNKLIRSLGNNKTLTTLFKPVSTMKVFIRYFLIRNSLAFIVLALMQPAFGTKTIQGTSTDMELVFAVDISRSMNTRDINNGDNRITVAKRIMTQITNNASISRVGLIIFAGNAFTELPLTADLQIAKMYINNLNTSLISRQGTTISSALNEANQLFKNKKSKKLLVVITDGEDHEGGIEEACDKLKDKNVISYIIGIGTTQGGIVPSDLSPNSPPLRDNSERVVVSKLNKQLIQEIAHELNGQSMVTHEPFPNLSDFLTQINTQSGTNTVDLEFKVRDNSYQIPLAIAIILLLLVLIWETVPALILMRHKK